MTGEGEERMFIMHENVLQKLLRTSIMLLVSLAMVGLPEYIFLDKPGLDIPLRNSVMDHTPTTALVAGMYAHDFPHELLDKRLERSVCGEVEAGVRQVGCLETAVHGAGVVRLGSGHLSFVELVLQESVIVLGLMFTFLRQVCVKPVELAVAVEFRPVVVPGFCAVFGLGDVV